MCHKSCGNQIHGDRLDFHLLKTQSTVVEMFESIKTAYFRTIIEEKCNEKRNRRIRLKYQQMKREFYNRNWIFKVVMKQFRATK